MLNKFSLRDAVSAPEPLISKKTKRNEIFIVFQLNFDITFGYNDIECGVEREGPDSYTNDVVIQVRTSLDKSKQDCT